MALTNFANVPSTTVISGGTTAPSSGSSETWTVSSSTSFPIASNTAVPPTQFHVADVSSGYQQEIITVTNVAGSTWTVTRGAEGTATVAHQNGFTISQVVSAGDMWSMPQYFNVRAYGAVGNGSTDDTTAIQSALTACRIAGGGTVYVPEGVYLVSNILQIGSNTNLIGAGKNLTTIRMKSGSWSGISQIGTYTGISTLQVYNGATASYIAVKGITFDGNEAGITAIPAWANTASCAPISMLVTTHLDISECSVINAIGYSVYLFNCIDFTISRNYVLTGQASTWGLTGSPSQQDGIHVSASQYGVVSDNIVDTGSGSAGDDAIALQSWGTGTSAILGVSVADNVVVHAAQSGIDLAMSGGPISEVSITGNVIQNTQADGIIITIFSYASGTVATGVTVSGNTFSNVALGGSGYNGITVDGYSSGNTSTGFADVIITGNTFVGFNNAGQTGIYVLGGSGLQINQNTLDQWNANNGIEIGNSAGPVGVTSFQVSGNTINMSTSTASGGNGILVQESQDGTISGNIVIGPVAEIATGNTGINIGASTSACTGIVVQGNRVKEWNYGVAEYNGGVASNNNSFIGNTTLNCTIPVNTTGTNTVVQPYVVETGGIVDIEVYQILTSAFTTAGGTTAIQRLFNGTPNGYVTLPIGTYFFDCEFSLSSMSATSGSFSFGINPVGATIGRIFWFADANKSATSVTQSPYTTTSTSTGAVIISPTNTTTTGLATVRGNFNITAAGTIMPGFATSVANASIVGAGSYIRIWSASNFSTAQLYGNWS